MNTMTREVTGVEVTETMDYWYDIVTRKEYRVKVIRWRTRMETRSR